LLPVPLNLGPDLEPQLMREHHLQELESKFPPQHRLWWRIEIGISFVKANHPSRGISTSAKRSVLKI
jgi:hypothetical protein